MNQSVSSQDTSQCGARQDGLCKGSKNHRRPPGMWVWHLAGQLSGVDNKVWDESSIHVDSGRATAPFHQLSCFSPRSVQDSLSVYMSAERSSCGEVRPATFWASGGKEEKRLALVSSCSPEFSPNHSLFPARSVLISVCVSVSKIAFHGNCISPSFTAHF